MPGIAAMDVGIAGIARRIISPQHITEAVAVEVAGPDYVVGRG